MSHDQLAAIKKLYPKKKLFKVPINPEEGEDQVEIELQPLGLDDADIIEDMDDNASPEKQLLAAKKLIAVSLGVEIEEAKISIYLLDDLMEHITKINRFNKKDRNNLARIKSMMKNKNAKPPGNSEE